MTVPTGTVRRLCLWLPAAPAAARSARLSRLPACCRRLEIPVCTLSSVRRKVKQPANGVVGCALLCGQLHSSASLAARLILSMLPLCVNSHCSCGWHPLVTLMHLGTTALHKTNRTLHDRHLSVHTAFMNTSCQYEVQYFDAYLF